MEGLLWFLTGLLMAPVNIGRALSQPASWLDWSQPESVLRLVYYGASAELLFVFLWIFLVLILIGIFRKDFLWGVLRGFEGFANSIGRIFAWAGLIMVLQQSIIVFVQRIFASTTITLGVGLPATYEISWWSEELKLYNAIVVCLCCAYTFVQGGHVRVDLIYAAVSFRKKKMIDMICSLVLMLPSVLIIWYYSWYFLWRHLITPKVSATDSFDRLMAKARAFRWNVETIGFSPNGFNAYFLFKVLIVSLCLMLLIQVMATFFRAFLEYREGPESEAKNLDKDTLGEGEEAFEGVH